MLTQNNGYEFLDFLVMRESEMYNHQRLAGSYAVIKSNDRFLLCFNTLRKQWEVPAGQREDNETPKHCAIRELYEETGQSVSDIEFKGLLKVKNTTTGEIKYNPVYFSTLDKLRPFRRNNEVSEIHLWDKKGQIGYIDEVDLKILDYFKG